MTQTSHTYAYTSCQLCSSSMTSVPDCRVIFYRKVTTKNCCCLRWRRYLYVSVCVFVCMSVSKITWLGGLGIRNNWSDFEDDLLSWDILAANFLTTPTMFTFWRTCSHRRWFSLIGGKDDVEVEVPKTSEPQWIIAIYRWQMICLLFLQIEINIALQCVSNVTLETEFMIR